MSREELADKVLEVCDKSQNYKIEAIATALNALIAGTGLDYYEVMAIIKQKLMQKFIDNPEKVEVEFSKTEEDIIHDRADLVEKGEYVDPSKYFKFIAYYDIFIYGEEGQIIKLEDANVIFLARGLAAAKCVAFYHLSQMCLAEGFGVRSIIFKKIEQVE